ncbi:MAG: hypothetical protein HZB40_05540 [Rhodocyclales bacterium]|nr:hypothetical protein [Rhodocyclales bacterium]
MSDPIIPTKNFISPDSAESTTASHSAAIESLDADSSDDEIISVVKEIQGMRNPDVCLVARLAERLAASGKQLPVNGGMTADVASTGGPSSLSTLLSPLHLRLWGAIVPKLGVPGRPAGGIDCLAQIPGYEASLDRQRLVSVLDRCGYAHFLADREMAPLDGRMFRLRQRIGAQDVPALVTASLLSKKLAVGVRNAGLDIRVAPWGNFGKSWAAARSNAAMFVCAATRLGISARPVLTDARFPYQPFLGRAESLMALNRIFLGDAKGDLASHADLCQILAAAAMRECASLPSHSGEALRGVFYANLEAQGADPRSFERIVETTAAAHRFAVRAKRSGFFCVSLSDVRNIFVDIQGEKTAPDIPFPDPVGAVLFKRAGDWVNTGEQIASVRADDATWRRYGERISDILTKVSEVPAGNGFEGIDNG